MKAIRDYMTLEERARLEKVVAPLRSKTLMEFFELFIKTGKGLGKSK